MNIEEIIAKAKEDQNFRKGLVMWAKDTEEGKEVLNNFATAEFDKKIGEKVSEIHQGYDNDVFEILGQKKKNEQKSYDFIKEIATELKTLRESKGDNNVEKVKELETKIKDLEANGSLGEYWKKMHDDVVKQATEKENELKNQLSKKDEDFRTVQIKTELASALNGLKFKEGIPKEAIDAMIQVNESKILNNAKIIDGKVVFHKEDGSAWLNNEYKAISSQELVGSFLGSMIDNETKTPGSGGGAPPTIKTGEIVVTGEGDNAKKKLVLDVNSFSTKLEFTRVAEKALKAQGVTVDNPDFNRMIDEARVEYKVSELEMK